MVIGVTKNNTPYLVDGKLLTKLVLLRHESHTKPIANGVFVDYEYNMTGFFITPRSYN